MLFGRLPFLMVKRCRICRHGDSFFFFFEGVTVIHYWSRLLLWVSLSETFHINNLII